ncbi:restriction endonuclease [Streptomyces erythrochromogenes]|uniref:restriction endonuclease n=1 Tax=Streptomyces erythrochromogenes TaxID=285574 RepID=UPI003815CDCB
MPTKTFPTRAWRERANTVGYISGGTESQEFMLRQILPQLPRDGEEKLSWKNPEGKVVTASCEDVCRRQLSTAGFVVRDPKENQWVLTEFSKEWLGRFDPEALAAHLHGSVKFFGELLLHIEGRTSQSDLLAVANNVYGLPWNSLDQIRRRTGWLRSLGMIELWNTQVVRTDAGTTLLAKLELCSPDIARGESGGIEREVEISEDLVQYLSDSPKLDQEALRNRRPLIGYIPRGTKSIAKESEDSTLTPSAAVRNLIALLDGPTSADGFRSSCAENLGITNSSFQSTLHALKHMGLIEQVSFNVFAPTSDAELITGVGNEQILVAFLHTRYAFFGEILMLLDSPSTTSALTVAAKERFGYSQASNAEIRLRLGFLQDAGLVERVDWQRFRTTPTGKAFADSLLLQNEVLGPLEAESQGSPESTSSQSLLDGIVEELQRFGNAGTESEEFEKSVAKAFRFLGFHAEHLGGSGRTDVLAVAQLAPGDTYRVIIDAKSSGNGVVSEARVAFDALREHKQKHKADYVVVVGPDFATRSKNWAIENRVIMMQIDDLVSTLVRHAVSPIPLSDMRDILSRPDALKDEMAERYSAAERQTLLVSKVLDLAFQEAVDEDPIASGYISVENIIYALRKEFSPRPSADAVRECLDFLSSPLVAALEENKGRYKLADSPQNVAFRLRGIGRSMGSASCLD